MTGLDMCQLYVKATFSYLFQLLFKYIHSQQRFTYHKCNIDICLYCVATQLEKLPPVGLNKSSNYSVIKKIVEHHMNE